MQYFIRKLFYPDIVIVICVRHLAASRMPGRSNASSEMSRGKSTIQSGETLASISI